MVQELIFLCAALITIAIFWFVWHMDAETKSLEELTYNQNLMKNKNQKTTACVVMQYKNETLRFDWTELRELMQDIKDLRPSRFFAQKKATPTKARLFA